MTLHIISYIYIVILFGIILGFKEKFAGHIIPFDSDCKFIFWLKSIQNYYKYGKTHYLVLCIFPPEYTSYSSDDVFRQTNWEWIFEFFCKL